MKLIRLTSLMILLFVSNTSFGIIDMKDANYAETWTDIDLGGPGYVLKVERTYNSRSIYDGIFGFGWCSDFETKIEITPDSKIKVIECGGGLEITYESKESKSKDSSALINQMVAKVKADKKDSGLKDQYFENLKSELATNEYLREALANELGFKGSIAQGKTYDSVGRGSEKIIVQAKAYKRILADGTYQSFDSKGRLIAIYDKANNFIKLNYVKDKLVSVIDNKARRLDFKYFKENSKVEKIIASPSKLITSYTYKAHDLAQAVNGSKATYTYLYDDLHNLTKVTYPDKTTKDLTYNQDKDWVVSFKDQRGCTEAYSYEDSEDDPRNHYWSEVVKTCNSKVTNKSKYEFWHKERADKSGKYLARVKSVINGIITDVKYHPVFGRPVFKQEGKVVSLYEYYASGMLKTQRTAEEKLKFFYKNSCNKVSKIVKEEFLKRKVASRISTNYSYYEPSCNLKQAINSKGEAALLSYDKAGRIYLVTDHTKKLLKISYDNKTGKPNILVRPGLGAIAVKYNDQGEINSVRSKQGAEVATQVAEVFNSILTVIGPAANDISI